MENNPIQSQATTVKKVRRFPWKQVFLISIACTLVCLVPWAAISLSEGGESVAPFLIVETWLTCFWGLNLGLAAMLLSFVAWRWQSGSAHAQPVTK
jgi:hypothetical protein